MLTERELDATKLSAVTIDENGPGTILADFETLLDFVGEEGVRSTGKYSLLPLAGLAELDSRMSRPLKLKKKRPQQRSYPHIHGLYILARTLELLVPKGSGSSQGRLARDPFLYGQWKKLNTTERYFNLLDGWFCRASLEIVSSRRSFEGEMASAAMQTWLTTPPAGRTIDSTQRFRPFAYTGDQLTLAMLEEFGLFDVEHGKPDADEGWRIVSVRRSTWGKLLEPALFDAFSFVDLKGTLQDKLRPLFPAWQHDLVLPEPEFQPGVHTFKVSLDRVWRKIEIAARRSVTRSISTAITSTSFECLRETAAPSRSPAR